MEFATGSSLAYELGLPKLMAKIKPMFCGWFRLEGYYESKSGYLTTVAVQTDSDGDFKVITMERQLRLRKKSARSLEDVIGTAQLLVLSLQLLESLTFIRGQPWPLACIYFFALHPPMQGADRATYLGGNRFTRTPQ